MPVLAVAAALLAATASAPTPVLAEPGLFTVRETQVEDTKPVFGTVRSKDRIEARVRTPGTIVSLKVKDGDHVAPGQVLAVVVDEKLALQIRALDARLVGLESRQETARLELERAEQLRQRGVTPQARLDQARTAHEVAANDLKAARAERAVVETQTQEGQVLAPAAGRVLKVPITEGSVVLAGESIATIAANEFLLRLELPERHARFIRKGDPVKVGTRGLSADQQAVAEGRIVQVYPELQSGRVVADAEVPQLGDYFVGERAVMWISAGKRAALVIPRHLTFLRFGLDFVRLKREGAQSVDVVVQLGRPAALPDTGEGIEVLAGLKPGDVLTQP